MNYNVDLNLINDYNTHKQQINANSSALLVIEMQEVFRSEMGLISNKRIQNVQHLISFANKNQMPVILVRHNDSSESSNNMINWWGDKLEKGSQLWEIIPEIDTTNCIIIDKSQYSAFYGTNLDNILKSRSINSVVICGLMTNCCCETAARDAFMLGYNVVFVNDATATINDDLHLSAIKNISFGFGSVINSSSISEVIKCAP
jgi:nicotinamidase-related amidase